MYHHISPVGKEINIPPDMFENHLRALQKNGWKTLSGEEFLHFFQRNEIPKKCVLITFDDGFADNYLFAYPLLKKLGMKAMLFVSTSFIEDIDINRDHYTPRPHNEAWDMAFSERRSEVMCTWKEIEEMEDSGEFDIQSHGHSHRTHQYIKDKKYDELRKDLLIGKDTLEKRLSKEVFHLSWPKGRYDRACITIASELGFKAIHTTERGANTVEDLKTLKRLPVKKDGKWLVSRLNIYSSIFIAKLYGTIRTHI
jgi:peptidoglycan/xylan/chitin deacetylase (PgdA/CDA1 family)